MNNKLSDDEIKKEYGRVSRKILEILNPDLLKEIDSSDDKSNENNTGGDN